MSYLITSSTEGAIPLWILPDAQAVQQLPDFVRTWLQNTRYEFARGSYQLIPGSSLEIVGVVVMMPKEEEERMWAIAGLVSQLPRGVYYIAQSEHALVEQWTLGWGIGSYRFEKYKVASPPTGAQLVVSPTLHDRLQPIVDAVFRVRDLVNTPAEDCGPAELSQTVHQLGQQFSASVREWVGDALLDAEFPMVHAVGRASHRAPRLIELEWGNPEHPTLCLIGKGVCFDTGGLDIKPSDGMRRMKKDMGGAAHTIALAQLIMHFQLPVHLILMVPAVDNAIAGNALRPGDVIRTPAGLSVEIHNTDAEGRLILGDALTHAARLQPDLIIDMATLTGAARVALGPDLPAVFTNQSVLGQQLMWAAAETEDPLWELPLYAPYTRYLKSDIADLTNAAAIGMAGATTAALYLEKMLVPSGAPWIHLDVYAWNDSARAGRPAGGEALGLRAFFAFLQKRYAR